MTFTATSKKVQMNSYSNSSHDSIYHIVKIKPVILRHTEQVLARPVGLMRQFQSEQSGADPGFGQGRAQLLRPKVADVAKRSCASEASNLRLGSRAHLRALEAFGFLMLKYVSLRLRV